MFTVLIGYINYLTELSKYDPFVVLRYHLNGFDFLQERQKWKNENGSGTNGNEANGNEANGDTLNDEDLDALEKGQFYFR